MDGRWVIEVGVSGWPSATPRITAGFVLRSRARSRLVTMIAAAPSVWRQQSRRRKGSAIMREFWWSSSVIGFVIIALPFIMACLRVATAIAPNCWLVVPYSCMWRRAIGAYHCIGT